MQEVLRELAIGINFVEITLELAIVLFIFQSYRKDRLEASEYAGFGFLAFAFTRVFYMIYDYYVFLDAYRYIAWVLMLLGNILVFISLFKGVSRSIFRDFPHKQLYFLGLAIYIVLMITVVRPLSGTVFYVGSVLLGILLLIPLMLQFNKLIDKTGGYIKQYFSLAIMGIPLSFLAIGIGPLWKTLSYPDNWALKIGMHTIFLISLIFLAIALYNLPSLNEFGWEKTLGALYILLPNGACIYSFNFKQIKAIDPQLLGSGLTGIVMMVQEMTRSKQRLEFIKQQWKNLYVDYGRHVTVALLGDEELKIISDKLEQFTRDFERLFTDLDRWEYSTEEFKIANMLVRSIFAI
ncbi:MAG: hypothetical protein ACTSQI_13715 [Candidatus Helarchaeota archaeon]